MEECSEFFHPLYSIKNDDPDRERKMLGWKFLNWISPRPTVEELKKALYPPIDHVKELGLEEFIDDKTNEKGYRIREGDQRYKDFSEVRLKIGELKKQKRPIIMQEIIDSREEGS
jgi:hypothetical protein